MTCLEKIPLTSNGKLDRKKLPAPQLNIDSDYVAPRNEHEKLVAAIWKEVLPDIRVEEQVVLNTGGRVAWAVRKDNPELLASLNTFAKSVRQGTLTGNVLFNRYYDETEWIENPLSEKREKRLFETLDLIKKYAARYGFDWIAIAAQAYQESHFDQSKKSRAGAVGVMQILPQTAADPNVGIADVHRAENNIHAGVKYMHFLRNRYFSDPGIYEKDRMNFSYAAYNAGPSRIISLRNRAKQQGLAAVFRIPSGRRCGRASRRSTSRDAWLSMLANSPMGTAAPGWTA